MAQPDLILKPFGAEATAGTINVIPDERPSGAAPQLASWSLGFPLITMTYPGAGGLPPFGQDMNGVLNAISQHTVYLGGGGLYKWSGAYVAAAGGYSKGAVVQSNDGLNSYVSLVDGNTVDFNSVPSSIGTSWKIYSGVGLIQGQATEASPGIAAIATTPIALDGSDDSRIMTPLKVKKAMDQKLPFVPVQQGGGTGQGENNKLYLGFNISAGRPSIVVDAQNYGGVAFLGDLPTQATGDVAGIMTLATVAKIISGIDTSSAVSPAGLKVLFPKRSFAENDYIRIPDVPGGLIIQFGTGTSYSGATNLQTLPTPFANQLLACGAQVTEAWSADVYVRYIPYGDRKSSFYLDNSSTTSGPAYYWAIGY